MRVPVSFVLVLLLTLAGCGDGDTPQESSQKPSQAARAPTAEPASEPQPTPAPAAEPTERPAAKPVPGRAPITPTAADPAPAMEPGEEPAKGGDEEFQPPSNWCGTGRVGGYDALGGVFWLYTNAKGEKKYVLESSITPEMLKQLAEDGWKLKGILSSRERDREAWRDLMKGLTKDR